jgi:autoinducer 2 (AI-2) kinase
MAAGVGAGIYESIADAAERLVKWERSYQPDEKNHLLFQEKAQQLEDVYAAQLDLVDRGLTTSMWKAPGV